jgi:hypothetical protein
MVEAVLVFGFRTVAKQVFEMTVKRRGSHAKNQT